MAWPTQATQPAAAFSFKSLPPRGRLVRSVPLFPLPSTLCCLVRASWPSLCHHAEAHSAVPNPSTPPPIPSNTSMSRHFWAAPANVFRSPCQPPFTMEFLTLQDVPRYHRTTVSYPRHSSELAPTFLEAGASTATRLPRVSEVSPNGSFATSLPINSFVSPARMASPASATSSLSSPAWEPARPHERYDSVIEPQEATKSANPADTVQQFTLPPLPAYPDVRSSACSCKCSCRATPSYHERLESSYQFQRHQAGYPRHSPPDREKPFLALPPVTQVSNLRENDACYS